MEMIAFNSRFQKQYGLAILIFLFAILQVHPLAANLSAEKKPLWIPNTIESFHFTDHGEFAFLNDGSIWMINPLESSSIEQRTCSLVDKPVTLMPEAGTEEFPLRIIVHEVENEIRTDFTVQHLSAPLNPDSLKIAEIDQESGNYLTITASLLSGKGELSLLINPQDTLTVKKWKKGQQVIIGGIWFPEYDPNEHKDFQDAYPWVLYNYHTGNYAFFTVFQQEIKP
jgi:hypothetical protein